MINMKSAVKIISIISFLVSFAVSCGDKSSEQKKDDKKLSYEQYELNCPVKSIDVRTYKATSKFGEVIKGDPTYGNYLAEFDEVGNLIKKTDYFSDGDIFLVYKCKYDKQNNLVEEIKYSGDGEQASLVQLEYDSEEKLIKSIRYDEDGNIELYVENEYDGKYLVNTRRVTYEEDGSSVEKVWRYKREEETLMESSVFTDGELKSVYKFSQYKENRLAEGVEYDADGVKLNEFYEEGDDYGVVLMRSHDYTDGSDYEYRVERNDRGHMIYRYNSDAENKEIYYGYTYDSKGNWTRKVEYHGVIRKPVEIVEREITY